jgi:hypothetical protein
MKMKLEEFTKWIEETRKYSKNVHELYKLGIDILEIAFSHPDTYLFEFVFNKAQRENISIWLYEWDGIDPERFNPKNTKISWDENGEEAGIYLDSIEALYDYISSLEDSPNE